MGKLTPWDGLTPWSMLLPQGLLPLPALSGQTSLQSAAGIWILVLFLQPQPSPIQNEQVCSLHLLPGGLSCLKDDHGEGHVGRACSCL